MIKKYNDTANEGMYTLLLIRVEKVLPISKWSMLGDGIGKNMTKMKRTGIWGQGSKYLQRAIDKNWDFSWQK
jgi:hypothetical protein